MESEASRAFQKDTKEPKKSGIEILGLRGDAVPDSAPF